MILTGTPTWPAVFIINATDGELLVLELDNSFLFLTTPVRPVELQFDVAFIIWFTEVVAPLKAIISDALLVALVKS